MARFPTTYEVRVLQERITLHRACFGADPFSVLGGLRSNYENRRDRPHPADLHATILHMAVSMFEKADTIERLARRHPARIGTHVMSLALQPWVRRLRGGHERSRALVGVGRADSAAGVCDRRQKGALTCDISSRVR